jgi:hypothetical protein
LPLQRALAPSIIGTLTFGFVVLVTVQLNSNLPVGQREIDAVPANGVLGDQARDFVSGDFPEHRLYRRERDLGLTVRRDQRVGKRQPAALLSEPLEVPARLR